MLLEISLAGFSSHWTFRGSRPFGAWAEAKPWLRDGGLCVIRTESAEVGDLLFPSIWRSVHGLNGGESRLDIRRIECGGQVCTPIRSLLKEFELDPAISPFEARDKIRSCMLDRSFLLVFIESEPVSPSDWEALVNLLEYYRKSTSPVRLSAIVIDGRGVVNSEPVCDFLSGRATHNVLSDVSSMGDDAALWPAYLHHRAAWEAGGSLSYSTSLAGELEHGGSCNDEELERILQAHADAHLMNHPGRQFLCELLGVGKGAGRVDKARQRNLGAELLALNVLWRPPSMNSLRVVPWASRALLAMSALPKKQVCALRHHLVCAPLAGEILSLCLQFESQILTNLHGQQDREKVMDQTMESLRRFKEGTDKFVVYPKAFPAPPSGDEDIWAFASLGENMKSCPRNLIRDLYWDTLHLRNAIAHGHYVGWHHVRMAHRMLRNFDTVA